MKFRTFFLPSLAILLSLTFTGCNWCNDCCVDWGNIRRSNNQDDMRCIQSRSQLPSYPLTLDEIVDIALSRNLSLLVKQHEYAIQREAVTRERFNMLPKLIFNWENYGRTENTASFSQSLVPGVPPAPLSISSEQNIMRWDMGFAWNLVDFGLSYYRSRIESNKVLIAQLEYERLRQNLVVDVTRQYWKAAVAKNALKSSIEIVDKALEQQLTIQRQMQSKIISEIQGLRNENQLINIRGQLQAYSAQYHSAMTELSLLMGAPSACDFEIADIQCVGVDVVPDDVCCLEQFALINRPELFSADVEERVRVDEARAAIIQMLPGVELFGSAFHDSNKYLLHNNWLAAGARATWNLLNVPAFNKEREIACMRKQLSKANRIALAAGVISQVHLAYLLYHDNLQAYNIAKELEGVNKRLLEAAMSEQRQGKLHQADILKYQAETLFSTIDAQTKYAELQNALEQLNSAIGIPRYFRNSVTYGTLTPCEETCEEQLQILSN